MSNERGERLLNRVTDLDKLLKVKLLNVPVISEPFRSSMYQVL